MSRALLVLVAEAAVRSCIYDEGRSEFIVTLSMSKTAISALPPSCIDIVVSEWHFGCALNSQAFAFC